MRRGALKTQGKTPRFGGLKRALLLFNEWQNFAELSIESN
jgi:hypothetical protein